MLTAGTILNRRFRLKHQFNDNPVRQTWLADDLLLKDKAVVKLLALGGSMQWEDVKLLEREAQILQQLKHPRLVKYRDYFPVDDQNFWFALVTEYIAGSSLKQKLDEYHHFTQKELQLIGFEVLEILNYLHQLNPPVLHRDIKPSNLIWGQDRHIYLIDFGSVQVQPRTPGSTFTVVGTFGYTPIEQFGGQAVPASDFYALGATLVHLLTGVPPSELPQENFKMKLTPASEVNIDIQFKQWLERLIEPAIDRRFKTAQEALSALKYKPIIKRLPPEPSVSLSQSDQKLKVEIPSRFSIETIRPVQKLLLKTVNTVRGTFKILPGTTPIKILGGSAIASFLGYEVYTILDPEIIQNIESLWLVPVALIGLGIPAGIAYKIYTALWEFKSFEKVQLNFDQQNFEIFWLSYFPQRKRGELSHIQQINLVQTPDPKGNFYPSLEIVTQEPMAFFFSRRKTYRFGHQLSEEELQGLKQQISDWLASKIDSD